MAESAAVELESVLEQDDEEFRAQLPSVLPDAADDPEALLSTNPEAFRDLTQRVSTMDDIGEFAAEEPETIEAFITLVWDTIEFIAANVESAREEITQEFTVTWKCTDVDISWHMETDPEAKTVSGGPGELEDAELVFEGEADVMFSMLGDEDFDGTRAFMQGKFQIDGPVPKAQMLSNVMDSAIDSVGDDVL